MAGMTANVKERLGTFTERLDSLEEGLRERTVQLVGDDLALRMRRYERVSQEFSKFFESEILSNIIDQKVDTH